MKIKFILITAANLIHLVVSRSSSWNCGVCRCQGVRGRTKAYCHNKKLNSLNDIPLNEIPSNTSFIYLQVSTLYNN